MASAGGDDASFSSERVVGVKVYTCMLVSVGGFAVDRSLDCVISCAGDEDIKEGKL